MFLYLVVGLEQLDYEFDMRDCLVSMMASVAITNLVALILLHISWPTCLLNATYQPSETSPRSVLTSFPGGTLQFPHCGTNKGLS